MSWSSATYWLASTTQRCRERHVSTKSSSVPISRSLLKNFHLLVFKAPLSSTAVTVQNALGQQIIGSEPAGSHSSELLLQCLDLGLGCLLLSLKLLVLLSSFGSFFILGCNAGICSPAHLLTAGLDEHKVDRSATGFQYVARMQHPVQRQPKSCSRRSRADNGHVSGPSTNHANG